MTLRGVSRGGTRNHHRHADHARSAHVESPEHDQAFAALANPADPNWGAAFALLADQPETARFMLETFAETLEQMGVVPSGVDPASGEPAYSLDDVARALGVPGAELEPRDPGLDPPAAQIDLCADIGKDTGVPSASVTPPGTCPASTKHESHAASASSRTGLRAGPDAATPPRPMIPDTQAGPGPFSSACRRCPRLVAFLGQVRAEFPDYHCAPVPPFGDPAARLLVVGLAPGMHGANASGRPFTGDHAGIILYDTLHRFGFASVPESRALDDGLVLSDCRITNAVKCLPPANKPSRDEVRTCNPYLAASWPGCRRGPGAGPGRPCPCRCCAPWGSSPPLSPSATGLSTGLPGGRQLSIATTVVATTPRPGG